MYTNPELSAQAKLLRAELQARGLTLTHAQTLEVFAKSHGARTLHVAQAKTARQGVNIEQLATRQTAELMFETLGRFEGQVDGLLDAISVGFALEASQGSRAVEAAMHVLFEQPDSPVVSPAFEGLRVDELPAQFALVKQRLLQTLEAVTGAPRSEPESPRDVYRGPMRDWRLQEGVDTAAVPAHHQTAFEVRVQREGHQLYIDIAPPHAQPDDVQGTDQLSLFIEVNEGRPCVHVSNDCYGDQVLTLFSTRDGLYLRPDSQDLSIRTGGLGADSALKQLEDDLQSGGRRSPHNVAFIPTNPRV